MASKKLAVLGVAYHSVKRWKVDFAFGFCLTAIVIAASIVALIIVTNENSTIRAQIDIAPSTVKLKITYKYFWVTLSLPRRYKVQDINMSSVTLEGISPSWHSIVRNRLYMKFDGSAVMNLIVSKLVHVVNWIQWVELKVSGKMNDGTPFSGIDTIRVMRR